jgi:signal transduction histidine kinase
VVLAVNVDQKMDGFIILENFTSENSFKDRGISLVKHLREHIISAFIKSRILEDLQRTFQELKDAQTRLIQSEKLASLGQLTAGIAHEIQNPLNFVNNFAVLTMDLIDEMDEYFEKEKDSISTDSAENIKDLLKMIRDNSAKINEHGKRAEGIVKGMLQHSRGKSGELQVIDINSLVKEYVNLAYHGVRAVNKEFNTRFENDYDESMGKMAVVPQDLSRVVLNIVNNACYAVWEKIVQKKGDYSPVISISTKKNENDFILRFRDNGTGMPESVRQKIFQPFFTTKPTGKGTGLGLSMSYDIILNIHKGSLDVISQEGEFTEFIITIPANLKT